MSVEPVIMRNGRSTSQVSVYDYPEHLNPFYEDENHKRLRFWKLGKRNGDSRRGSFSISGLKEMWAFKSFRLKKKSSSLGINKTSESPPPMRRALDESETHYDTYDPRMRYTTGTNTLNGYFDRNVPYRSSLQDIRASKESEKSNGDLEFTRNNKYRSTIQGAGVSNEKGASSRATGRRYVYGGSVTPQPSIRSNFSEDCRGISRGTSQLSVSSANPFEDDDDDVVVGGSNVEESDGSKKSTPNKRPLRKKRKAPPPPVPVPKIIIEESPSNPATPSTSQSNQIDTTENINITNLTNEIENFVKTKTDDLEDEKNKTGFEAQKLEHKDNSINIAETNILIEKQAQINEDGTSDNKLDSSSDHSLEHNPSENISFTDDLQINEANKIHMVDDDLKRSERTTDLEENTTNNASTEENINNNDGDVANIELKITESKEDLSIKSETSNEIPADGNVGKFQIRYIPLKESSPESEPEMRNPSQTSVISKFKEPDSVGTYERRRSVKEIIESINRSQSLLKVNQDQIAQAQIKVDDSINNLNEPTVKAPPRRKYETKENLSRNVKNPADNEHEINRIVYAIEGKSMALVDGKAQEAEVDELIEKLTDKLNNNENTSNEIFKKCSVNKNFSRESSPISSNLDWNPVPKPKRTKGLSPELTNNSINGVAEN